MPALLFELGALYVPARRSASAGPLAWLAAWVAVGLAATTKGPVAIIPVSIWVAFYVLRREWSGLRRMRLVPAR